VWQRRPLSAIVGSEVPDAGKAGSFHQMLELLKVGNLPKEEDIAAFAEALSGSDLFDWVRLRPWRASVMSQIVDPVEKRRLLAAIFSRLAPVHCTAVKRQRGRGDHSIIDRMIVELLTDAIDFLRPAMEEFCALAASEMGDSSEEDVLPEIPSDAKQIPSVAKLWSARFLVYFCRALQILIQFNRCEHLKKGLELLESFLDFFGYISYPQTQGRLLRAPIKALKLSRNGISRTLPDGKLVGGSTMWEELAPPSSAADGCFRGNSGTVHQHTWTSVYAAIVEVVAMDCCAGSEDVRRAGA